MLKGNKLLLKMFHLVTLLDISTKQLSELAPLLLCSEVNVIASVLVAFISRVFKRADPHGGILSSWIYIIFFFFFEYAE